jgi:alpha-L-fucosidase 2
MNHINVFGYTGVAPNASEWSPESTAWLIRQLWEHYLFTQDRTFLRTQAYPVLREHAEFWLDYLTTDSSTLVVTPSYSPEHGDFTAAASYSQMIVWDLLTNTIAASELLNLDRELRSRLRQTLARLDPGLRIGSWGQLQEWRADLDDPTDGHRHLSHLYALYPGHQISPEGTPDYFAAARISVVTRTNNTAQNDIGWNRAQKANLFARLRDGNSAREQLDHLLWRNTFANFLNDWPFQIDGNFGVASAMAEMLLQSHLGTVDILPALPDGWAAHGSFDGLRARGAFTVGVDWVCGIPSEIRIYADHGGPLALRSKLFSGAVTVTVSVERGPAPSWSLDGGTLRITTRPGGKYLIRPA